MSEWPILGTLSLFYNVELSKLRQGQSECSEARHETNRLQDANRPLWREDPWYWATVCDTGCV